MHTQKSSLYDCYLPLLVLTPAFVAWSDAVTEQNVYLFLALHIYFINVFNLSVLAKKIHFTVMCNW